MFAAEIPVVVDRGLLRINTEVLKKTLEPNPIESLNRLYMQLPEYLTVQANTLKDYLTKSTASLESSTLNIDDFVRQTNSMK
jgi:hypothetical protein